MGKNKKEEDDDILYLDVDELLGNNSNTVLDQSNKVIPADQLISDELSATSNKLKELAGKSDETKMDVKVNDVTASKQEDTIETSKKHTRRSVMRD